MKANIVILMIIAIALSLKSCNSSTAQKAVISENPIVLDTFDVLQYGYDCYLLTHVLDDLPEKVVLVLNKNEDHYFYHDQLITDWDNTFRLEYITLDQTEFKTWCRGLDYESVVFWADEYQYPTTWVTETFQITTVY